jgi:hypothetical protein
MVSSVIFGDPSRGRFLGRLFGGHLGFDDICTIVAIVVLAAVIYVTLRDWPPLLRGVDEGHFSNG